MKNLKINKYNCYEYLKNIDDVEAFITQAFNQDNLQEIRQTLEIAMQVVSFLQTQRSIK